MLYLVFAKDETDRDKLHKPTQSVNFFQKSNKIGTFPLISRSQKRISGKF